MKKPWWYAVLIAAPIVLAVSARAETRNPDGIWQGTIQGMLRLVLHVGRDSTGALTGKLDSPDQGAMGLAIDTLTFRGDSLRFVMRRLQAAYAARMSEDGQSLFGQWSQAGVAVPLDLKRSQRAPVLVRPQEPQPPFPYRADTVRFANVRDGVSLAGTLTLPREGGPFPAVILITGSGPEDRDETIFGHRPFLVLADHLTRRGIAVLRVDDRGVGASSGTQRNATSEDFAGDVLAGAGFLKTRPGIDRRRIGLVGHSEGGLIGPLAAARSKDVAFLVLLAGPGLPGDSLLLLQNAALLRAAGAGDDMIAKQVASMRRVLTGAKAGADSAAILAAMRDMVEAQLENVPPDMRGQYGNVDSLAAGAARIYFTPWMQYFIATDPRPTLEKLRVPVLAITGEKDVQVTPENVAAMRATFAKAGNRAATVKLLPGLNHMFQRCTACTVAEYGQLEETMAPVALDEISGWILRTTARR